MEPYVSQSPIRGLLDIRRAQEELSFRVARDLKGSIEHFIETIGDPFLGSREKGRRIFEKVSQDLADFIEEVKEIEVEIKVRDYDFRAW